jgi:hypothetical protein
MKISTHILAATVLCVAPGAVAAQGELVLDAGVGALAGGDFTGTRPGPTLAAALHFADWGGTQGGIEFAYSRHGGSEFEGATTQLEYLGLIRHPVASGPIDVHVGGKMGVSRRSLTVVGEPARTDGFVLGPSATVRFPVGTMRVQFTLDALYETFEELVMYNSREYGTDEDGMRLALRVGVVFPLPGLTSGGDGTEPVSRRPPPRRGRGGG